jgi:hypothetical protein
MTILDIPPPTLTTTEDNNPLKKLNDELMRITINYINTHLYEYSSPHTVLTLLPREVRRHHINNCWLADEKILYQIKSYEFNQLNFAKEILSKLTHDYHDTTNNRFRRYTDGNKQYLRKNKNLQNLTTCQDDLHIRPLELDTNRSIFNEKNLWIAVTVRSFTNTNTFLAVNVLASTGISHLKNDKLHWFEAVKLGDKCLEKLNNIPNYCEQELNNYSMNESALTNEFQSIVMNIE